MNEDFIEKLMDDISDLLKDKTTIDKKEKQLNQKIVEVESKILYNEKITAIDYVTTLELIKYLVNFENTHIFNNGKLKKISNLVLDEIEPTLDNLTLERFLIVLEQYKSLVQYIRICNEDFFNQNNNEKLMPVYEEMYERHKVFRKIK